MIDYTRQKTPHQFSVEKDEVFDYLFSDYNLTMLVACKPRWPCSISKDTC